MFVRNFNHIWLEGRRCRAPTSKHALDSYRSTLIWLIKISLMSFNPIGMEYPKRLQKNPKSASSSHVWGSDIGADTNAKILLRWSNLSASHYQDARADWDWCLSRPQKDLRCMQKVDRKQINVQLVSALCLLLRLYLCWPSQWWGVHLW